MRKSRSVLLVFSGILCIAAGLGLAGYNLLEDNRAAAEAGYVMDQINEIILANRQEKMDGQTDSDRQTDGSDEQPAFQGDMPAVVVDGYRYVGVITIPSLSIQLPIMEEWDYTRMKLSPCRYEGSVYQNDMIICAHNYRSHFGQLDNLQSNDNVYITDTEGNVFCYQVVLTESLPGTAVEEMSAGNWDLTLFTCTYSGTARVTVRCRYIES